MKILINFWACLSLAVSGLVLFWFVNIILFGSVSYHETNLLILISEYLISLFMFIMSFYIAWNILFKRKNLELV